MQNRSILPVLVVTWLVSISCNLPLAARTPTPTVTGIPAIQTDTPQPAATNTGAPAAQPPTSTIEIPLTAIGVPAE